MDWEKTGRTRMMMRLPRHRQQIAETNFLAMTDILEAYGKAAVTLDELRKQAFPDPDRVKEYEALARKLEGDVVRILAAASPGTTR